MTAEKAIEHLENIAIFSFQDGYTDEARKALDMAIEALEKQIPKKPIITEDIFKCVYKYRCPECAMYLGSRGKHSIIIFEKPKYCSCGQKLDWSEDET